MNDDPRIERVNYIIDAIQKRLEEARARDAYDDTRVDLLAIIQFVQRNLARIDTEFPPEEE